MKTFKVILLLVLLFVSAVEMFVYLKKVDSDVGIRFLDEVPEENTALRGAYYISGAVKSPGTYPLKENLRLAEAIKLANGFDKGVDIDQLNKNLNLALMIQDEDHLYIPFQEPDSKISQKTTGSTGGVLINVNTGTKEELANLPGVGESTAQKIIANRPYSQENDLLNVPGIGEAKLANLLGKISF